MAAAFVKCTRLQGVINSNAASASVSATAGNTLIALSGVYYPGSAATPTMTVTGGGTWVTDARNHQHLTANNDNFSMGFASVLSATGGTATVTVTWSNSATNSVAEAYIYEFSGMPASSILDTGSTPVGQQGAASPVTTPSLTNANAADVMLAVGVTYSSGNEVHGAPTNSWTMPANGDETNGNALTSVTAYRIVAASAAQSTTWTDSPSVPWTSFIAAYKAAAATTFPITRSITQAQALTVSTSKVFLRTVSLTQAQSASVALRPSVRYFLTGTATQAQALSVAVQQARLPSNYYTTTFPLTENPVSEGNVWRLGGTDGLDWTNPRTTPGKLFATQGGADAAFPSFKDSIAVLRGTWGADQEVIIQVFNGLGNVGAYCEAEALLRFTISAHSVTGYEVTLNCNPGQNYIQINRWTGGPGGSSSSYVQIGNVGGVVSNGDIVRATVVGSTLNVYRNGSLVLGPITDTNIASGSPGAGAFYNTNGGTADVTLWGIARFTAHTIGTPWPLGGTILQGQSLRLVQQPQIRRALSQAVALSLARGARLSRLLAQPQAVGLSVASRVIPLLRSVTQATSASLSLRKVILRVVNTTQGQALQFVRFTRLSRAVSESEALSLTIQSSGGGPIHPLAGTCAVSTSASLTWTWRPAPAPPRLARPVTPPLTLSPADQAPALTRAAVDLPPTLQPAYAPVVPPS